MARDCDPNFARVDEILDLLTKSKSLHILLILDNKKTPMRFSEIKSKVESSSTTISIRLKELENANLIVKTSQSLPQKVFFYELTEDAKALSPIMKSFYDWVEARIV